MGGQQIMGGTEAVVKAMKAGGQRGVQIIAEAQEIFGVQVGGAAAVVVDKIAMPVKKLVEQSDFLFISAPPAPVAVQRCFQR